MKTSKKLLITVAGVFVALMVTGLFLLRSEVQSFIAKNELQYHYEEIPVAEFDKLDFSDQWVVQIRQGREYKVEVGSEMGSSLKPDIQNIHKMLYFKINKDTSNLIGGKQPLRARITTPRLHAIKAKGDTRIQMKSFQADTLSVALENNSTFTGDNNKLNYSTFQTSGNAWLEFMDDPND